MLRQAETELTGRLEARLTPFLEQVMSLQRVPGMAVGVVEGDALVYARGFGTMRLGRGRPVTPETLFHMASVTKPFVGTALMQLADAGKVDLDAPVTDLLPYFSVADERLPQVTARRMLAHVSGMPDTDDYEWENPQFDDGALERYVRSLSGLSLLSDPGTDWAYSNIAYEVLGDMIAKASGEAFEDYVTRAILRPLGMERSNLMVREADPELVATGHILDERGDVVVSEVYPYNRAHAPSSTLCSNVVEMACWAAANLSGGALHGTRILNPETHAAMLQPVARIGDVEDRVWSGISWRLSVYRGTRIVRHSGGDVGFTSQLAMAPERGVALCVMVNSSANHVAEFVRDAILEVLLG